MNEEEMKAHVLADLEQTGRLEQLRAKVRYEVYHSMAKEKAVSKKELSNREVLTVSIISDWLNNHGFSVTAAQLNSETQMGGNPLPKTVVKSELRIDPSDERAILDSLIDNHLGSLPPQHSENARPSDFNPEPPQNPKNSKSTDSQMIFFKK
ncbi:Oidioi.mRNA.OKI2018_I69.PAR.g10618.t1.cds [Oikopleura dioica]|uniref:Oidioi.mRNA.OKI2018_I69.PAR.g10618.t1.cds n=1 Tax=Oikopleura dioica TaxID=34765 RepID=A0ABN7RRI4_OIKDI|nr:Oidioi.mRNA.OKI2018_I69.PAR.g10618.t1.cds [Oikopleura dioica]